MENKVVVITGANRGIGLALAKESARRKARLILIVRKKSSVTDQMLNELKSIGAGAVDVLEFDFENVAGIPNFVEDFWSQFQADVLINNAGLWTGGLLENQDPQKILSLIHVNITALTLMSQGFLKHFVKRKSGKIVNNASVMGEMCFPAASVYAASKSYVIGFTSALRQELKGTGVSTLLMYTPGVKTGLFDEIYDLYGGHLDLDILTSIPAEDWSKTVLNAIEDGDDEVRPDGITALGLNISQHFPKLFESIVSWKFHR